MAVPTTTAKIAAGIRLTDVEIPMMTNEDKMLHLLMVTGMYFGTAEKFRKSYVWRSLVNYGTTELIDVMEFTDADIDSLAISTTQKERDALQKNGEPSPPSSIPLGRHDKKRLRLLISCYNYYSKLHQGPLDPYAITKNGYDAYRIKEYNHVSPLVPWNCKGYDDEQERKSWDRGVKRNTTDYPPLKDDALFTTWQESMMDVAQAHGTDDMLNPTKEQLAAMATNPALTLRRSNWMYQVFVRCLQTSTSKAILKLYRDNKDIPKIWGHLCKDYGESVLTSVSALETKRWLMNFNFEKANWKGTAVSMIEYCMEQRRRHDLINPTSPITDENMIELLRIMSIGHKKFEPVYTTYQIQRKGDANAKEMTLFTYVALLRAAAQQIDASNGGRSGRRDGGGFHAACAGSVPTRDATGDALGSRRRRRRFATERYRFVEQGVEPRRWTRR